MAKKKQTKKKTNKKVVKRIKKQKSSGPDALSLALYLISFILIVFGAWYHQIHWIVIGFIPFLVALWYEHIKRNSF